MFIFFFRWDIGILVVFFFGDWLCFIVGLDMVMDFIGSGGGLFLLVLGIVGLEYWRKV